MFNRSVIKGIFEWKMEICKKRLLHPDPESKNTV